MDAYIGEIRAFAAQMSLKDWLPCDGALYSTSNRAYVPLFSVISNRFGGDGKLQFAVPNLCGRTPLSHGCGSGLSCIELGKAVGVASVTVSSEHFPTHSHRILVAGRTNAASNTPGGRVLAISGLDSGVGRLTAVPCYNEQTKSHSRMADEVVQQHVGNVSPHNNLQPYLPVCFYICYNGISPSPDENTTNN